MGDFTPQLTSARTMLQNIDDMFRNTYSTQISNNASSVKQLAALQQNVTTLKARLANVKKISDTYDREYQDRMNDKPLSGFWRSRGITTLQDWVLFIFFLIYAILSVSLAVIALTTSTAGGFNAFMILATSFSLGVMITAVIVRFA
jgi:hypothetical protein